MQDGRQVLYVCCPVVVFTRFLATYIAYQSCVFVDAHITGETDTAKATMQCFGADSIIGLEDAIFFQWLEFSGSTQFYKRGRVASTCK